jgi:hypothetical protein
MVFAQEPGPSTSKFYSAMKFCTRAEQVSGLPVLATCTNRLKNGIKTRPVDLDDARKQFVSAVREAKPKVMATEVGDSENPRHLSVGGKRW